MDDTQVSQNGSRSENMICKEGIVRAVHGDTIDVEITVSSACAGCHAKSICIPSEQRQETVPAVVPAGLTFQVGERVNLIMRGRAGGKAVLIAYVIPFLVLITAFLVCNLLFHNELLSVFVCVLFLVVYFLILKKQSHKIDQKFTFYAAKIISDNMDSTVSQPHASLKIIGITGTLGAGKGTIVDYLIQQYGFKHYSVRGYLTEEAKRRGLEINRDTFVEVANDLRAKHSPSFITDELYKQAEADGCNAIIESVRTPGEVESLRKNEHFLLFAVDADPKIRYERIVSRNSETDHVTFETFLENERREMSSTDPNHQNVGRCMEMADFVFQNNGDFNDLYNQVETAFATIV